MREYANSSIILSSLPFSSLNNSFLIHLFIYFRSSPLQMMWICKLFNMKTILDCISVVCTIRREGEERGRGRGGAVRRSVIIYICIGSLVYWFPRQLEYLTG